MNQLKYFNVSIIKHLLYNDSYVNYNTWAYI